MGMRDTLNKAPALVFGFVILAVAVAVWIGIGQFRAERPDLPTGAYYTTDDGKTWYVDKADLIPPVQHEGKEAVRLIMFTCGDKQIPGYLERYTPEAKEFLTKAKESGSNAPPPDIGKAMGIVMNGKEVKKIGEKNWIREANRAESLKVIQVRCDDGQPARMARVDQ